LIRTIGIPTGVEVGEVVGNRRCEARRVIAIEAGSGAEHGTGVRSRAGKRKLALSVIV